MLRQDLFPWHTLLAVAEELGGMLVAQEVVVFNNLGLSCPFLLSEECRSFRRVFKERCWWGSGPTGTAISEPLVTPSTLDSLSEVESSRIF